MVTWPARLDTERCDLPMMVVPIYLLAFLHPFERLGWQELGQATGAPSVAWIRAYDCWSSDLAAQRLLRFNPERHYIPLWQVLLYTNTHIQIRISPSLAMSHQDWSLVGERECDLRALLGKL